MNLQEITSKRNKLMVDAQALITKEAVTTEDRANFDKMIAAADVDSADITRMQAVENFNKEQNRSTRTHPSQESDWPAGSVRKGQRGTRNSPAQQ